MMIERRLKIFMTGGIAVLCALIVAGNIRSGDKLFVRAARLQHGHNLAGQRFGGPRPANPAVVADRLLDDRRGGSLTAILFALGTVDSWGPESSTRGTFTMPSGLFLPEPVADSLSGSSPFLPLAANGLRCGSHRPGMASSPRFASSPQFFLF